MSTAPVRRSLVDRFMQMIGTTRAESAEVVEKGAVAAVPAGGRNFTYGFSGAGGNYTPHEPFTQAWQKGVTNANARDPLLLAFSAVYSCVTIISQDLAKMPIRVMNIGEDKVSLDVAFNSPYHRVLRKPNNYQTSMQFIQLFTAAKLIRGNAYAFKELDERGVPRALHWMHPDRMFPMINPVSKEIYYQYTPDASDLMVFPYERFANNGMGTIYIPSRFILHDRINTLWHPLIGVSPLYAAAVSASTGGRILLNTEKLFSNMARPSGMLTAPGEISDTTAERLKREFEGNYSAGNFGRTAVLGDGLSWQAMVMTSTDAQLIEQLKWTIEDVARVYRVPMYLLNDATKMTYKNSEQAATAYFSGCLQYHVEETETAIANDFGLDEQRSVVSFDVSTMFRMDTQERLTAYGEAVGKGIFSPNEVRAMEGKGPVKGGEEPRIQMQYVPMSTVLAPPAPAPAPTPAPAEPVGTAPPAPAPKPAKKGADDLGDNGDDEEIQLGDLFAIARSASVAVGRARSTYEAVLK